MCVKASDFEAETIKWVKTGEDFSQISVKLGQVQSLLNGLTVCIILKQMQ